MLYIDTLRSRTRRLTRLVCSTPFDTAAGHRVFSTDQCSDSERPCGKLCGNLPSLVQKLRSRSAVGNSPLILCSPNSRRQLIPIFDKPAFSRFSQLFQPRIVVHHFGKIVKRQVCQKWGWVADGCPQTKILEGLTKDEIRIFDWLFNGSLPKSSTHTLEKCFENPDFIIGQSFQNLRLGGINFGRISHGLGQRYHHLDAI